MGHDVRRENHIGDWGTPFGMLIEHLLDVGEEEAVAELSVGDLDRFYKEARAAFDASDELKERSRQRVVLLQSGDAETLRLWRILVDQSAAYFQTVYDRLDVLLTVDDIVGESAYNDDLPTVVADLDAQGLLVVDDGADCVFPPGFTNREGEPQPMIVRKADGGYGYAATDLATIRHRVDGTRASRILYVVGAPQRDHFEMVFAVARLAGWLPEGVDAEHIPFGNVLGADGKMFKTRSGETVRLVDLLDEAVDRAAAAIAEKNPDLVGEEAAAVARAVGIGAVKYADLSSDRVKDYVLDFDRMLAFEGNTGPYMQYAHARIRSIFRRGEVDPSALDAAALRGGRAGGAGPGPRPGRLRRRGAVRRGVEPAPPAVHLPVRPGPGLHHLLRGVSGAAGRRRRHPQQSAGALRPHRPHPGHRPRPARHRRPGPHVTSPVRGRGLRGAGDRASRPAPR